MDAGAAEAAGPFGSNLAHLVSLTIYIEVEGRMMA